MVALQLVFALLSIAAGMFLISQLTLGGMVLEAALSLVGGGPRGRQGVCRTGRLGSAQMYELRAFVDQAIADYRPTTR